MRWRAGFAVTCVSLALGSIAWGQATREFNWIPSGKIAVGDERSEAAARYWSDWNCPMPAAGRSWPPRGR